MKLTVLNEGADATRLCTYCPKLCRPACQVSTTEGRETVTPWGKMRAMDDLLRGATEPTAAAFEPSYACTGCLRCKELCDLDNPVAETLRRGRAQAMALGVANPAVNQLREQFATRMERVQQAATASTVTNPKTPARTAYLPGCTSVVTESMAVIDAVTLLIRAVDGSCNLVADGCCGQPLLDAGAVDEFVQHAQAYRNRLREYDRIIVADPGCMFTLKKLYPKFGITLPKVEHLTQQAVRSLSTLPTLDSKVTSKFTDTNVIYHDACKLGRGLSIYDEPRQVLTKLLGQAPLEMQPNRAMGLCSGAGGLLPKTRKSTAKLIAQETVEHAQHVGGKSPIVTCCSASRNAFRRAGATVVGMEELLAQAFSSGNLP